MALKTIFLLSLIIVFLLGCLPEIEERKVLDQPIVDSQEPKPTGQNLLQCNVSFIQNGTSCCKDLDGDNLCDQIIEKKEEIKAVQAEIKDDRNIQEDSQAEAEGETSKPPEVGITTYEDFSEQFIESGAKKIDLGNYPYVLVNDGKFDAELVVGKKAPSEDVISISNIAVSLNSKNIENVGSAKLDSDISDIWGRNAILVGSPCSNKLIDEVMGESFDEKLCIDDYRFQPFEETKGVIWLVEKESKHYVLVMGYEPSDTRNAAAILANYGSYDLSGWEYKI